MFWSKGDVSHRHWGSQYHDYKQVGKKQNCTGTEEGEAAPQAGNLSRETVLEWFSSAAPSDGFWVIQQLGNAGPYSSEVDRVMMGGCPFPSSSDQLLGSAGSMNFTHAPIAEETEEDFLPGREDTRASSGANSDVLREDSRAMSDILQATPLLQGRRSSDVQARDMVRLDMEDTIVEDVTCRRSVSDGWAADDPIVQFAAYRHFAMEGEETMLMEVARIGNLDCISTVKYATADASAKAGVTYQDTHGTLRFEVGENLKRIEVPLIDDDAWNPTLEFVVKLLPDEIDNCTLGRYLFETRVSVADDDAFPTNRFKESVLDEIKERAGLYYLGKLNVPKVGLFVEYVKLNLRDPMVWKGSVKMLICDQLHNLYLFQKLFVNVYMVDRVLQLRSDTSRLLFTQSRMISLALIMIVTIVPFAILHYLDYIKYSWRVRGISKKTLQGAIIRKFLNYKNEVRSDLSPGVMILAMTRDAVQVVDAGYMNLFALAKAVGSVLLMLVYQFIAPVVFNKPFRLTVILPMCVYPACITIFICLRTAKSTRLQGKLDDAMDEFIGHVDNTVLNFQVISDYDARTPFVALFEEKIGKFNNAAIDLGQLLENNAYFAPWLSLVLVAMYTIKGGMEVLNGHLSLGTFLIDVHIFQQIGVSWGTIYTIILALQAAAPCLERVTTLLNFPIDLSQRMALNRFRRKMSREASQQLHQGMDESEVDLSADLIPIRIIDRARQSMMVGNRSSTGGMPCLRELELQQGRLVYLLGPHGEGKSELLRLFAGATLPLDADEPNVFVASHLRCLHVSSEPLFFEGSLYDNLTLGVKPGDPDLRMERVLQICRSLGLPRYIRDQIESKRQHVWSTKLSQTQRQLLSLARAFVANPEFLCVHKPFQVLDEYTAQKVLELLALFVEQKGIEQDAATFAVRRPRTCLLTSNRKVDPLFAHTICWITNTGIQVYKDAEIT